MGYIKNEYVVAFLPDWTETRHAAFEALEDLRKDEDFGECISVAVTMANGKSLTYILAPDGSKEGWEESNKGDEFRKKFIEAAKLNEFADILHFQMGGDDQSLVIYEYRTYKESCGDVVKDEKQYTISDLRLKLMELNKIRRDNHAEHMNNAADYFLDWLEEKK